MKRYFVFILVMIGLNAFSQIYKKASTINCYACTPKTSIVTNTKINAALYDGLIIKLENGQDVAIQAPYQYINRDSIFTFTNTFGKRITVDISESNHTTTTLINHIKNCKCQSEQERASNSVWRDGTGSPPNSLGLDGDYLDDNGDVYLKSTGTYNIVANIKGSTGAQGSTGPQGIQGPTGKGFVNRNTWSVSSVSYVNNSTSIDFVTYNGTTYYCILSHTSSGISEPGIGGFWTTYWSVLALKGDGKGFNLKGSWDDAETNYLNNTSTIDVVTHNGTTYYCVLSHNADSQVNDEPGVGSSWQTFWSSFVPLVTTPEVWNSQEYSYPNQAAVITSIGHTWTIVTSSQTFGAINLTDPTLKARFYKRIVISDTGIPRPIAAKSVYRVKYRNVGSNLKAELYIDNVLAHTATISTDIPNDSTPLTFAAWTVSSSNVCSISFIKYICNRNN